MEQLALARETGLTHQLQQAEPRLMQADGVVRNVEAQAILGQQNAQGVRHELQEQQVQQAQAIHRHSAAEADAGRRVQGLEQSLATAHRQLEQQQQVLRLKEQQAEQDRVRQHAEEEQLCAIVRTQSAKNREMWAAEEQAAATSRQVQQELADVTKLVPQIVDVSSTEATATYRAAALGPSGPMGSRTGSARSKCSPDCGHACLRGHNAGSCSETATGTSSTAATGRADGVGLLPI